MSETFDEWAFLELMGHRKLGGKVSEATLAGAAFIRIDVYTEGAEAAATQFYSPSAVYCITPTTEDLARGYAKQNVPRPIERWELARGDRQQRLPAFDPTGEYRGEDLEDDVS